MKWAFLFVLPLAGQSLHVYSELARVDAKGEVTAPAHPREILSPALVRKGFTSFQIAVQTQADYWLVVGQNPDDAVKITVYRESGAKLEPVTVPYATSGTQVFWMDVWTDAQAPVRRIKVEPQIYVGQEWMTYPMEARVMDAVVPDREGNVPCRAEFGEGDVAKFRLRNARQDAALAAIAPREELKKLADGCEARTAQDPEFSLRIRDYLFRMR